MIIRIAIVTLLIANSFSFKSRPLLVLSSDLSHNSWKNLNIFQTHALFNEFENLQKTKFIGVIDGIFQNERMNEEEWLNVGPKVSNIFGVEISNPSLSSYFDVVDKDSDGYIEKNDVEKILKKIAQEQIRVLTDLIEEEGFQPLNHDDPWINLNDIQKNAFILFYTRFQNRGFDDFIESMIKNFDKDQNQVLDLSEWFNFGDNYQYLVGIELTKEHLEQAFKIGDTNVDLFLDKNELDPLLNLFFTLQLKELKNLSV